MEIIKEWKCFGGTQRVYRHHSGVTHSPMEFALFVPPGDSPRAVLYFLSGLTCTWENVVTKGGAQAWAREFNVALICPDTSPRGPGVPDHPGEDDMGWGAGFYLSATEPPFNEHYHMDRYVLSELPQLAEPLVPGFNGKRGIFGHSMGGHGALSLAIKNPDRYLSTSAFSPIAAPCQVPWGRKAFRHYLGEDEQTWQQYDTTCLLEKHGYSREILVDVGTLDPFLESQLRPELLEAAAERAGAALTLRRQDGYDHSYYFIATFMRDHIAWHTARLAT